MPTDISVGNDLAHRHWIFSFNFEPISTILNGFG